MNLFEQFLASLDGKITKPTLWGLFHITALVITIILTVLICTFAIKNKREGKSNDKLVRVCVLIYAIVTIILEIYKQLNFSFNSTTGEWSYQWYAFPFQFCSTPMYVALIAGCLKKCEFQKYLYAYIGTFVLFAGLCVMFYPNGVFVTTIGINIQTMVCHGGMIVIGVLVLVSGVIDMKWTTILKAIAVFAVFVVIALIMNIIFNSTGNTANFNMFYISPYRTCTLPLLQDIQEEVPYIIFLLIYIIGFSLAAFIIFAVAKGLDDAINKRVKRNSFEDDNSMNIIFRNLKNLQ